jgi:ActR/RegA family two-component response regulator
MTSNTRAEEAECVQRLKLLDEDTSLERQLGESMISRKWSLSVCSKRGTKMATSKSNVWSSDWP